MTIVAIHQPNYLPWLGFFHKLARSGHFVFLDHVQYSKNSYINRTQILDNDKLRWLTVPVRARLGDPILDVLTAGDDWPSRHLSTLYNAYRRAAAFRDVWRDIEKLYEDLPALHLAASNRELIRRVAHHLRIGTPITASSEISIGERKSDDALVEIVRSVAPEPAIYLSGKGGAKYQDAGKFSTAGIELVYSDFSALPYDQGNNGFEPGLSVLDAVFHTGWDGTRGLLRGATQ